MMYLQLIQSNTCSTLSELSIFVDKPQCAYYILRIVTVKLNKFVLFCLNHTQYLIMVYFSNTLDIMEKTIRLYCLLRFLIFSNKDDDYIRFGLLRFSCPHRYIIRARTSCKYMGHGRVVANPLVLAAWTFGINTSLLDYFFAPNAVPN